MPLERPDWDTWALGIAKAVSERGDCNRRQVGAVILDEDHGPVSFGYNGTFPGGPSCLKGDCPRGRHYKIDTTRREWRNRGDGHGEWATYDVLGCACGQLWPCSDAVAPGSSYDTGPGACHGVHAELNALLQVSDRARLKNATLYITDAPCDGCMKIIKNTAISRIIWPGGNYVR